MKRYFKAFTTLRNAIEWANMKNKTSVKNRYMVVLTPDDFYAVVDHKTAFEVEANYIY